MREKARFKIRKARKIRARRIDLFLDENRSRKSISKVPNAPPSVMTARVINGIKNS